MTGDRIEILEADHHRNGVGGEPFYVGLIRDHDENRTLLLTWFPEYVDDGDDEHGGEMLAPYQTRIAVIDPAQAAAGNVYMHSRDAGLAHGERGGNAWRGDHYGTAARAVRDHVNARHAAETDAMFARHATDRP